MIYIFEASDLHCCTIYRAIRAINHIFESLVIANYCNTGVGRKKFNLTQTSASIWHKRVWRARDSFAP